MVPVAALACAACLGPKLEGHKVRSDEQEGMPYYLPRPYLLVTKNFNVVRSTRTTTTTTRPDGTRIQVVEQETGNPSSDAKPLDPGKTVYAHQIVYLPDRCNQYALRVSRGIGTLSSEIALEEGERAFESRQRLVWPTGELEELPGSAKAVECLGSKSTRKIVFRGAKSSFCRRLPFAGLVQAVGSIEVLHRRPRPNDLRAAVGFERGELAVQALLNVVDPGMKVRRYALAQLDEVDAAAHLQCLAAASEASQCKH